MQKKNKKQTKKKTEKQQNKKDLRSLQENWRYQGNISCKDEHSKGQNGMDLIEAEDTKKRWQEYTEELHKKETMV